MKHALILALAALALAGCAGREEKLCKAQFGETLLNPETAKFSGFEPVAEQDIEGSEQLGGLRRNLQQVIPPPGATYFRMKVRAQGELGNEITRWQFCAVNNAKDTCFCVPAS